MSGSPPRNRESYGGSPRRSPLRAKMSPGSESSLREQNFPPRNLGPMGRNVADLSYKYKDFMTSPGAHIDNKTVTRHLAQASVKKK